MSLTDVQKEKVKEYLVGLAQKLKDKEIQEFWVMADREDFKPIRMRKEKVIQQLAEKAPYYRNKRIAQVLTHVIPKSVEDPTFYAYSIKITLFELDENAVIRPYAKNQAGLCVNFYPEDALEVHFTLKMAEAMLRLLTLPKDRRVTNNTLTGQTYSSFQKMLRERGHAWDF